MPQAMAKFPSALLNTTTAAKTGVFQGERAGMLTN
jgi:hypothetical protein